MGGWLRLPHARAVRTGLRTLHVLAVATLFGGHVHGVAPTRLSGAAVAAAGTGLAFLALEAGRRPLWLVQVRGAATLAKMALLGLALAWPPAAVPALGAALALGVVASHMPGAWRYHSLWHGRVAGPTEKG